MEFLFNDGGRKNAGYVGETGDCACRAIAIATQSDYQTIYDLINHYGKMEKHSKRKRGTSNARTGVYRYTMDKIMLEHFGWKWNPTMKIGQGCKVHLKADELPMGRILCNVSKHYCAVIDGVVNDTHDPSREGTRCVYGYYSEK